MDFFHDIALESRGDGSVSLARARRHPSAKDFPVDSVIARN